PALAARACPGEHGQVRSRAPAHDVRDLLGRRGRRRRLAGRRPRDSRDPRVHGARVVRLRTAAAPPAAPRRPAGRGEHVTRLKAFGLVWWDFVVGDDWVLAAGVVAALAVTWFLTHRDVSAWWLMPLAVVALLAVSLRRASRDQS